MEANAQKQQVVSELTVDGSNGKTLDPRDLYRNDPWMLLFRERLSLNNWRSLAILVIVSICCFYGLYQLPGTGHGLDNQPLFALFETMTATLFYISYHWLPDAIAKLFNTLSDKDVLSECVDAQQDVAIAYAKFRDDFLFWINGPVWSAGTLIFILLYLIIRSVEKGPPFLMQIPLWLQLVTAALDGIIAYYAFMSVIRLFISLIFANRLFRSFKIRVKPLHPDRVGGFGVMRYIVWISVLIILATTLTFFETIQLSTNPNRLSSTLDTIVLIAAYVILTPTLILGWLILPHLLMLNARNTALKPLVDEFQAITQYPQAVTQAETASILAENDRLSAIKQRYSLIWDTFPTWPLEITQVRRLVAALSLPALISLIPSIVDLVNFITQRLPK